MRRRALCLALGLFGCSDPPPAPPVLVLCSETTDLEAATREAARRWSSATGRELAYDCEHAGIWVYRTPEVPSAADLAWGTDIRVRPELDAETAATAIAHEAGHAIEGSGENRHTKTGLMEAFGGDGRINEESLRFVCSGLVECADFRPEA